MVPPLRPPQRRTRSRLSSTRWLSGKWNTTPLCGRNAIRCVRSDSRPGSISRLPSAATNLYRWSLPRNLLTSQLRRGGSSKGWCGPRIEGPTILPNCECHSELGYWTPPNIQDVNDPSPASYQNNYQSQNCKQQEASAERINLRRRRNRTYKQSTGRRNVRPLFPSHRHDQAHD